MAFFDLFDVKFDGFHDITSAVWSLISMKIERLRRSAYHILCFFLNGCLEGMIEFLVAAFQLQMGFLELIAFFHQLAHMALVLFRFLCMAVVDGFNISLIFRQL